MQIMKKFLTIITLVLMSIDVNAQTTFNLRAGVSSTPFKEYAHEGYYNQIHHIGGTVTFQANIPINMNGTLTVSPTALLSARALEEISLGFPIYLGYKIPTGYRSIFYPKIGPAVYASYSDEDNDFAWGLSVELAQEYKHFIIAVNYLRTIHDDSNYGNGVYFTLGYKF